MGLGSRLNSSSRFPWQPQGKMGVSRLLDLFPACSVTVHKGRDQQTHFRIDEGLLRGMMVLCCPLFHLISVQVGVIGIGGLGHLAIQYGKAFGLNVVTFSRSDDKRDEALAFGASDHVVSVFCFVNGLMQVIIASIIPSTMSSGMGISSFHSTTTRSRITKKPSSTIRAGWISSFAQHLL